MSVFALLIFASHMCNVFASANGFAKASPLRTLSEFLTALSPTAFNLCTPGVLSCKAGCNDAGHILHARAKSVLMRCAKIRNHELKSSKHLDAKRLAEDFATNDAWHCPGSNSLTTRRTLLLAGAAALTVTVPGATAATPESSIAAEVVYPSTLLGLWVCQRMVLSVEGDAAQAESIWSLLGGDGDFRKAESYMLQYIAQPAGIQRFRTMLISSGVVLDRGLELKARVQAARVNWDVQSPDTLSYKRNSGGDAVECKVVQRTAEPSIDKGWGSNEVISITSAGSASNGVARVQRRFKFTDQESRDPRSLMVEGMEVVETYSSMDEAIGNKKPTSTTKSMIKLMRPEKKGR